MAMKQRWQDLAKTRMKEVGMTPEQLARIFEPFVSYKTGGTGLGLAIVQSIVSAHHGHLSVKSVPGSGSSFCILLPIPLSPVEKSAQ